MTFDAKTLIDGLQFLLAFTAFAYAFFVNRRKDVDQRFTDGSGRMDRLDARLTKTEQAIKTMPGKDDVHALQMTLSEVGGDMKAMAATMAAMAESQKRTESIVTRHEDHLRKSN